MFVLRPLFVEHGRVSLPIVKYTHLFLLYQQSSKASCAIFAKMYSSLSISAYLFIALLCAIKEINSTDRSIKIVTSVGEFIGSYSGVNFGGEKKSVRRFLGIPFAKPPIGDLRFAPSVEADELTSPYDATFYRPHCPQREDMNKMLKLYKVHEDCLHLNIFVPGNSVDVTKKYDVMIWLYGGAFAFGGADEYPADVLSAFNDIIVVTFNYRTNVFGFIKSSDSSVPGNAGLWDQHLAIKWVHKNIGPFGGDPEKITLFGQSAGGASVIYQALFNVNDGLFKRIIAQSGSPLAPWAYQTDPDLNFEMFTNRTNCNKGETSESLKCLRSKSSSEILSKVAPLDTFVPTIDSNLIKETPGMLFSNTTSASAKAMKLFSNVDFMSGVNSQDGAIIVSTFWANAMKKLFMSVNNGVPKFFFDNFYLPATLKTSKLKNNEALMKSVQHRYTDWADPQDKLRVRQNMIDMSSDIYFFVPAVRVANMHSETKTIRSSYFYEFSHRSSVAKMPSWVTGASHTTDIPYVFGFKEPVMGIAMEAPVTIPESEIKLSREMMTMWTNFAKTG